MISGKLFVSLTLLLLLTAASSLLIEQNGGQVGVDVTGLLKLRTIVRNIDGSQNNEKNPDWGKSYTNLKRRTPIRYEDGKSKPLNNLPNPRFLSESVSKLEDNIVIPN